MGTAPRLYLTSQSLVAPIEARFGVDRYDRFALSRVSPRAWIE